MNTKMTDAEYHASLPKKQVGTAVLFFNTQNELLILKPNYKDGWLVPGGSNDEGESTLACAIRETHEEIGLRFESFALVGVLHSPGSGYASDSLKFIFNGGILSENQIQDIRLQTSEFDEMIFLDINEAIPLLLNSLQKSIPQCFKAIQEKSFAYIDG